MEDYSKQIASFNMSPSLLAKILHLPDKCEILGAQWWYETGTVRFYVCGPDFDELQEGEQVPNLAAMISTEYADDDIKRFKWEWILK
jgi:hypothetical protein